MGLLVTRLLLLLSLPPLALASHLSFPHAFTGTWGSDTETSHSIPGNTTVGVSVYFEGETLEPTKQGAEPTAPSSWTEVKHSRRARSYLAFPTLPSAVGVGASLVLLMLLLLWVSGRQLPGPKPKAPAKPEEQEPAEEEPEQPLPGELSFPVDTAIRSHALWRLAFLRGLFPAAESLASAVGTDDAQLLLRTIKENAAIREQEEQLDSGALVLAVRTSFGALRRLHEVAIEHAAGIARDFERADEEWRALQLSNEEPFFDGLAETQREPGVLVPLKAVLQRLCDDNEDLSRRFHKTHTRLSTGRVFKDEGDEQQLEAAAADLHRLVALQTAKKRTLAIAAAVKEQGLAAVKTLVTGNRTKFCRMAKVEREMAAAQLRLAGDRLFRKYGVADERQAALTVGKTLREVQALLYSFDAGTINIEQLESFDEVKQAADEGLEKQKEIKAALDSCWQIIIDLCSSDQLEAYEREKLVLSAARGAQLDATEQVAGVRRRAERLRALFAEAGHRGSSISGSVFSGKVIYAVSSEAKEIEDRAEQWLEKCRKAMEKLESAPTLSDASINMQTLTVSIAGIVEAEKSLKMLETSWEFLKILQDDIENTATRAAVAASDILELPGWATQHLQQRLELFSASYRRATSAKTLQEAASSAITMHVLVEEMERISEVALSAKQTKL